MSLTRTVTAVFVACAGTAERYVCSWLFWSGKQGRARIWFIFALPKLCYKSIYLCFS